VFAVFNYLNDAATETSWRLAYEIITQEIRNMDKYIPELKGILDIWFEFLPAYQNAIEGKARMFVTSTYGHLLKKVSTDAASTNHHIAKMLHTAETYSNRIGELRWQKDLTYS
jgi:hypothetical protein